jgi:D-alanyl-D-alanine endopeptidase (penicillin-binding protein 7)
VIDQDSGETLLEKNADTQAPVASLTKLMTALVVLDANLPRDEMLEITNDDIDRTKHTPSRLKVGTKLTRDQLLLLALMASENRAAMALSRNYPGGRGAFIAKMNAKARELGMRWTHFDDPAGLSPASVSTPRDLHRLMTAAAAEPVIRHYSTQPEARMKIGRRNTAFINSNRLVRRRGQWDIELQKTGYTNEAGRCLVMQTRVANRRLAMIFLDSFGKLTRYGDASRVRQRIEREFRATKVSAAAP